VRCNVSGGSCLEWLPQETIIFDGARGQNRVRVDMDESGRCAVWDIVCLGRPASDETFEAGYLRQGMEIYRADQPVYLENNLFSGGGELLQAPWGLRGCPVAGTFVITLAIEEQQLSELRNRIVATENEWFALSDLDGLLVARYLGHSTAQCRKVFTELWRALRPDLVGVSACEPRIWHT
jgi:urease accessory protein